MCVITTNIMNLLPVTLDVNLYSDTSREQASVIWLKKNLIKKFHDDKMSKQARKAGLDKFIESNEKCRTYEVSRDSYYYELIKQTKHRLREIFFSGPLQENSCSLYNCIVRSMPGPGSSLGTKETSFYGKLFQSKMTTYDTSGFLYRYYRDSLSYRWQAAEKRRFAEYGLTIVDSSMMSFAHKNQDECRTINTEASLEMQIQKGAASIIEELLVKFYNIDISRQPKINRMLARLGSLDGSFATIDLKDGSNRISYTFMREVLPLEVFLVFDRLRAKCIEVPESLGGQKIETSMFSTQGNGFTFALQTLIFACLTESVYSNLGLPRDCDEYPHFSVFGDDIIVTKHAYYQVTKLLEECGFTVNLDKSYNSGEFRESCGADFFKGKNIRSVYIKRIRHERHKYSVFNRLCEWSIRNSVDLTPLLCYLKGLVDFRPVPLDEHEECGIRVPSSFLTSPKSRNGAIQYFGYHPTQRFVDARRRFNDENPDGLMVSILHGSIVNRSERGKRTPEAPLGIVKDVRQGYLERQQVTKYLVRGKSTSSWDFIPRQGLTTLDYAIALECVLA